MLGVRLPEGTKDAVVPLYETVPATSVAPWLKIKVVSLMVDESIGTLKVAVTILLRGMHLELFAGSVDITMGDTIGPVLKAQT